MWRFHCRSNIFLEGLCAKFILGSVFAFAPRAFNGGFDEWHFCGLLGDGFRRRGENRTIGKSAGDLFRRRAVWRVVKTRIGFHRGFFDYGFDNVDAPRNRQYWALHFIMPFFRIVPALAPQSLYHSSI